MRGVEVRIRHEDDEPANGATLAEVPFTERGLDDVIRLLKMWGVQIDDPSDGVTVESGEVYGQFVVKDGRVWFDVFAANP